ncbi:MAG: ATP-grasp domain-containing protein [Lachnospiraceae bacterium]|nr:ATP-grasp domain-containing protein [Lachnospiraceae bacterium]
MSNKKGLIIYAPEDVEKNRTFIEMCSDYLRERKNELEPVVLDNKNQERLERDLTDVDFVINRSRNSSIARQFEEQGIRVFNSAYVTEVGNDKWKTYELAVRNSIPVMKTEKVPLFEKELNYPLVLKSRDGHGGSEVFLVHDKEEYDTYVRRIGNRGIIQPVADSKGRDVRAYVIGGKVVVAICRQAGDGFKSNFSLGGDVSVYELGKEELEIVNQVVRILKPDYAGIDIMWDGDRVILNEIEDAVGARMVYATSNINIVGRYIDYICQQL